jgi:hypothetical protein
MRITLPRFSIGSLIILVAMTPIALVAINLSRLGSRYREMAAQHAMLETRAMERLATLERKSLENPVSPVDLDRERFIASREHILRLKYERAAKYPWIVVEPDRVSVSMH